MRIAYLVTEYPRVSHSFIRREIRALEALGVEVGRFTLRGPPEAVVDADDQEEARRTRVILGSGLVGLLWAATVCALRYPIRFVRALALAVEIGWRSERGLILNLVYLAEACVLRRWIDGYAHVHAHFGTNSAAVAMLCHELGGPGYSFTCHGPEEFDKPLLICLRQKIERARFVVAISSFGRSQLYRHCGFAHWGKIEVVHCGVDEAYLSAAPAPLPDRPRLVTVGRLNEQKGQMLLVRAVAELVGEGVELELFVVGDGEMRAELDEAIAERQLGDRVHILGWATAERVREELEAARLFVLPSFAEGLPVVLMEALALGRPAVTTFVAGIPELVEAGACGWLVPAGSVEHLVEALREALQTESGVLERMGAEGRRRVLESHDIHREARKLLTLFECHVPQSERRGAPVTTV